MTKTFRTEPHILRDLSVFYGRIFGIPPLAAKIYAFLLFDFEKQGITFDDLVTEFEASKSSVSCNLKLLLEESLISEMQKTEARKRFFTVNEEYAKIRFNLIIEKMQTEAEILTRLHNFRDSEDEHENEKFEIYRSLLNRNIKNIQDSLIKLYDEN